jgi:hypothetical protein
MRILLLLLLFLCCSVEQAWAWADNNCRIYPKAYRLTEGGISPSAAPASSKNSNKSDNVASATAPATPAPSGGKSAASGEGRGDRLLLALTIVPPPNTYLYGPDSKEACPPAWKPSLLRCLPTP